MPQSILVGALGTDLGEIHSHVQQHLAQTAARKTAGVAFDLPPWITAPTQTAVAEPRYGDYLNSPSSPPTATSTASLTTTDPSPRAPPSKSAAPDTTPTGTLPTPRLWPGASATPRARRTLRPHRTASHGTRSLLITGAAWLNSAKSLADNVLNKPAIADHLTRAMTEHGHLPADTKDAKYTDAKENDEQQAKPTLAEHPPTHPTRTERRKHIARHRLEPPRTALTDDSVTKPPSGIRASVNACSSKTCRRNRRPRPTITDKGRSTRISGKLLIIIRIGVICVQNGMEGQAGKVGTTLRYERRNLMPRLSSRRSRHLALAGALLGTAVLPMATAEPANAATREVHIQYLNEDGWGVTKYDIRFNGTVKSNGPTGYIIDGDLNGYCSSTLTGQSMTFGYGPSGQSWSWKSYWCTDEPHIHIEGTRAAGDSIDMKVGATAGVFNTYEYSSKKTFDIGND